MKHIYTTLAGPLFIAIMLAMLPASSPRTWMVTGTLVNEIDAPIASHQVYLYNSDNEQVASDKTDDLGRFTLAYEAEPTSADPGAGPESPITFKLGSSYPNPFNPMTTVPFEAPESTTALIAVYNILGQEVMRTHADLSPGNHEIAINLGGTRSQGQYLLRVVGDGYSLTRPMTFVSAGITSGTPGITVRSGGSTQGGLSSGMQTTASSGMYRIVVEGSEAYIEKEMEVPTLLDYDVGNVVVEWREYPLEIVIEGQGIVDEEVVTARSYDHGTMVRLKAIPAENWQFMEWQGDLVGTENPQILLVDHGKFVKAVFKPLFPVVTTSDATDITAASATIGGTVVNEGTTPVTERGVCYAVTENPDFNDICAAEGAGIGDFTASIADLDASTTYFVRAYATNEAGTAFGAQTDFTTLEVSFEYGSVTDIDGNEYRTIVIGNQEWMAENLRVTRYRDESVILTGLSETEWQSTRIGAWKVYPHDPFEEIGSDEEMMQAYGILYNWYAVDDSLGLCPSGWSVPSDTDWKILIDYVVFMEYPNTNVINGAGNALKSRRQVDSPLGAPWATEEHPRWDRHNTLYDMHHGKDIFGFSALAAGYILPGGQHIDLGNIGIWWSSTAFGENDALRQRMDYNRGNVSRNHNRKWSGYSVRCIRD